MYFEQFGLLIFLIFLLLIGIQTLQAFRSSRYLYENRIEIDRFYLIKLMTSIVSLVIIQERIKCLK